MENNLQKIAIIGSGISGLECASLLDKSKKFKIFLFEASSEIGGRLKKKEGFCDYPVELGGEEIHGEESYYYKTAIEHGAKPFEYWDLEKFYCFFDPNDENVEKKNKETHSLEKMSLITKKYPDLKFIEDLFEDISYEINMKNPPNISIANYLREKNISENTFFYAEAIMGSECGSEIEKVSLSGFQKICEEWESGTGNYCVVNMSHWDILRKKFADIIENKSDNVTLKCETPIKKIDISDKEKIKIYDENDCEYIFDKCILTVPLPQYKKINFFPQLPKEKIQALDRIGFDSLGKIIIKFKECFWPKDAAVILIPGLVNFWTASHLGKNSKDLVLYSLVGGKSCRLLTEIYKKSREEFLDRVFEDFEKAFGKNCKKYVEDFIWFDWAEQPYIGGGYSFITVEEKENDRKVLQENIDNRLFFAGEAFGINGHIATIHGAIDTAVDLCNEIIN